MSEEAKACHFCGQDYEPCDTCGLATCDECNDAASCGAFLSCCDLVKAGLAAAPTSEHRVVSADKEELLRRAGNLLWIAQWAAGKLETMYQRNECDRRAEIDALVNSRADMKELIEEIKSVLFDAEGRQ